MRTAHGVVVRPRSFLVAPRTFEAAPTALLLDNSNVAEGERLVRCTAVVELSQDRRANTVGRGDAESFALAVVTKVESRQRLSSLSQQLPMRFGELELGIV